MLHRRVGLDPAGPRLPRGAPRRAVLRGLLRERMHKPAERSAGGSLPATSGHGHGGIEPDPLLHGRRRHGRGPVHDRRHGPGMVLHILRPLRHGFFSLPVGCDEVGPGMEGGEVRARGEEGGTKGMKI